MEACSTKKPDPMFTDHMWWCEHHSELWTGLPEDVKQRIRTLYINYHGYDFLLKPWTDAYKSHKDDLEFAIQQRDRFGRELLKLTRELGLNDEARSWAKKKAGKLFDSFERALKAPEQTRKLVEI